MPDFTIVFTIGAKTKTLTIPSAKVSEFELGWLETNPMLTDDDGKDLFPNTLFHFANKIKTQEFRDYKSGKTRIKAREDAGIDTNIIMET